MRLPSIFIGLLATAPISAASVPSDPFNGDAPFGEPDTGIPIGGPIGGTSSRGSTATSIQTTIRPTTAIPTATEPLAAIPTSPNNNNNNDGGDNDGGNDNGDDDDDNDFSSLEQNMIPMSNTTFHVHRKGRNRIYQLETFPFGNTKPSSCALYARFQADHSSVQKRNKLIYVFLIDGKTGKVMPFGPKGGHNVAGQFMVKPGETMVNHYSCHGMQEMRFQFRIAGDHGPGDVSFVGDEWNGLFLSVR